jgi:hypothetical protein
MMRADPEFWFNCRDFLQRHAPDSRLFQMFDRDDLLAEIEADE